MSADGAEATLSTFTATDGANLAVQDWPLPEGVAERGTVLITHGLGEHAGRYDGLARQLNSWGFRVRGYDHFGHGDSDGPRGGLSRDRRLVEDLADVVGSTRALFGRDRRMVLLGHSMGGLVAAAAVASNAVRVDALVLSSPALDLGLSPVQRFLLSALPRIAPDLRVGNGLDAKFLSHDVQVVAAYKADRRVHDRISGRLARFMDLEGRAVLAAAPRWRTPTLLLYAGDDRLVSPEGSRAFAEAAPRGAVTTRCFPALYHEIFNEPPEQAQPVFGLLKGWLDARF